MSGPLVVLVGPPGAGKSTVGKAVAEDLAVEFRDTDVDIEAIAGRSIADIFIDHGEPAFRAMERQAVATALAEHAGVLALGGGAVLDPDTRQALVGQRVVFLDVGLAAAFERTGMNHARPLLAVNPRATLKHMLDERRPVYEAVAAVTVSTDGRSVDDVVADVVAVVPVRERS